MRNLNDNRHDLLINARLDFIFEKGQGLEDTSRKGFKENVRRTTLVVLLEIITVNVWDRNRRVRTNKPNGCYFAFHFFDADVELHGAWRKRDTRDPNSTVARKIHGKNDMVFSTLKTVCINATVGATTYGVGMVYKRLEVQGRREILDDCSDFRVMTIRSSPVIAKIRHVDHDIDFPTLRISRFLKGLVYGEKTGKAEQRSL